MPANTIRLMLTKRADAIACSYGAPHVRIVIVQRRAWWVRLFLGNPYAAIR